jgi:hypothetical protein
MNLFDREINLQFSLWKPDESFLLGIHSYIGETECCGDEFHITEIGFCFFKITILVEKSHATTNN